MTYGSRALGTRLRATFRSSGGHFPDSKPKAIPIRLRTSMSSWISNMLSKLNKYSNLSTKRQKGLWKEAWGVVLIIKMFQGSPCIYHSDSKPNVDTARHFIWPVSKTPVRTRAWEPRTDGGRSEKRLNHILVTGDAAVDDSFLAGVYDDEGEVDDGIGRGRSVCLLLPLPVSLDQVLESYLLQGGEMGREKK